MNVEVEVKVVKGIDIKKIGYLLSLAEIQDDQDQEAHREVEVTNEESALFREVEAEAELKIQVIDINHQEEARIERIQSQILMMFHQMMIIGIRDGIRRRKSRRNTKGIKSLRKKRRSQNGVLHRQIVIRRKAMIMLLQRRKVGGEEHLTKQYSYL